MDPKTEDWLKGLEKQLDTLPPGPWKRAKIDPIIYSGKAKEDRKGCLHFAKGCVIVAEFKEADDCMELKPAALTRAIRFFITARQAMPRLIAMVRDQESQRQAGEASPPDTQD